MIVAVIGSSGNNAAAWTQALMERGHYVRHLTRGDGFDLDAPDSFPRFFEGIDVLTIATPADPRQVTRERALIEAARRIGISRIVKLSVIGAERETKISPFARWHAESEAILRASGIASVILRPNFYMQNLLRQRDTIRAGTYAEALGVGRVSYVDVRDIGRVAARVCEGGYDGQALTLTGPRAYAGKEMAGMFAQVVGRSVSFESPDPREAAEAMLRRGRPAWHAEATMELYTNVQLGHAPHIAEVTSDVQLVTGNPPAALEDFAREFLAALA